MCMVWQLKNYKFFTEGSGPRSQGEQGAVGSWKCRGSTYPLKTKCRVGAERFGSYFVFPSWALPLQPSYHIELPAQPSEFTHTVREIDYKHVLKKELQGEFDFSRSFCFYFEVDTELRDGRFSFTHSSSIL